MALRVAAASSGTLWVRSTTPPARSTWPASATGLELQIAPGCQLCARLGQLVAGGEDRHAGPPRAAGRRPPHAARAPRAQAARARHPARGRGPRARHPLPAASCWRPRAWGAPPPRPDPPSRPRLGITAAVRSGTAAPVDIRTAVPASSGSAHGCPARDSPTTLRDPSAPAGSAKPSIAEPSNGGTATSLTTFCARTLPSASRRGTSSAPERAYRLQHATPGLGDGDELGHAAMFPGGRMPASAPGSGRARP